MMTSTGDVSVRSMPSGPTTLMPLMLNSLPRESERILDSWFGVNVAELLTSGTTLPMLSMKSVSNPMTLKAMSSKPSSMAAPIPPAAMLSFRP